MVTSIEEHHRRESVGADLFCFFEMIAEDFGNASGSIFAVHLENPTEKGHRARHRIELSFGHFLSHSLIEVGFNGLQSPAFSKVSIINFPRMLWRGAVFGIETPVR